MMSRTSLPVPQQQKKKSAVGRVLTSIRNKVKSSDPVAAPTAKEGRPTDADPFQQVKSRIAQARQELALLVTNDRAAPGGVTDILRASDDVLQRATKAQEFAAALQALKAGMKFAPAITVYANDRAAAAQAQDTVSKLPNLKHRVLTEFAAQIDNCLNQADELYAAATTPEMVGPPCSLLQDMVAQIVPAAHDANKVLTAVDAAIKKARDALAPYASAQLSEVLTAQSKVEAARAALERAATTQEALEATDVLKGFDRDLKLVKRKCEQASQAPETAPLGDSPASSERSNPQEPGSGREYQPLPASVEAFVEPPSAQDTLQDSQADGTALPAGHGEHAAATSEIDPQESGRSGGHVEQPLLKEPQPLASNDYGGSSDYGAFTLGIKPPSISELVEQVRRNLARNTTDEIQAAATLITRGEKFSKVAFTGSQDIIKELTPEEFKKVCGYLQSNPELLEIGLQKCVEENLEIAAQALVNLPNCAEELQKKLTPEQRDQIVLKIEEFKTAQAEADRLQAERFESAKHRLFQLLEQDDIASAADFLNQQNPADDQLLRELLTQQQRDQIAAPPLVVKPSLRTNPARPVEAMSLPTDRDEAIRWLIADFERIMPIVERAQRALPPLDSVSHPHELTKVKDEVVHGFQAGFQDGNPEQISQRLVDLENLARQALNNMNIVGALRQQQASLPVDPAVLTKDRYLASGNFADTYVLSGPGAPPLVAKVLKSSVPDAAAEIDKEAEAYARLGDHPNIARCYGKQLVEGSPALVMEQVQGGSAVEVFNDLAERYNNADIDREKYLGAMQHIVHGILLGLSQFEAAGLAHRDIKGDNIRFDPVTNEPKILDMGLVQGQGSLEQGNFPYRWTPPEAFTTNQVGGQFDSFGLGQTIHQQLERPLGEVDPTAPWKVTPLPTDRVSEGRFFVPGTGTQSRDEFDGNTYPSSAQRSIGADGKPTVMPLTQASGDKASGAAVASGATPGRFGVATSYVDFMNRLLHPDPQRRMTPSEALRHPFMTDRLLDKDEVAKVLCPDKNEQPAEVGAEQPAAAGTQQRDELARKQHDDLMRSIEKAAK